jgi:hypothetical protein
MGFYTEVLARGRAQAFSDGSTGVYPSSAASTRSNTLTLPCVSVMDLRSWRILHFMPLLCSPPYVHIFFCPLSLLSMCLDVHIQIFEQMPGCISRKSGVLRDRPAQPSAFSVDNFQVSTSQGRVTRSIHIRARTIVYTHVTRESWRDRTFPGCRRWPQGVFAKMSEINQVSLGLWISQKHSLPG